MEQSGPLLSPTENMSGSNFLDTWVLPNSRIHQVWAGEQRREQTSPGTRRRRRRFWKGGQRSNFQIEYYRIRILGTFMNRGNQQALRLFGLYRRETSRDQSLHGSFASLAAQRWVWVCTVSVRKVLRPFQPLPFSRSLGSVVHETRVPYAGRKHPSQAQVPGDACLRPTLPPNWRRNYSKGQRFPSAAAACSSTTLGVAAWGPAATQRVPILVLPFPHWTAVFSVAG